MSRGSGGRTRKTATLKFCPDFVNIFATFKDHFLQICHSGDPVVNRSENDPNGDVLEKKPRCFEKNRDVFARYASWWDVLRKLISFETNGVGFLKKIDHFRDKSDT